MGLFLCPKEVKRCQETEATHVPFRAVPISWSTVSYCEEHRAGERRKQYNKYDAADVKQYGRAWKRIRDRYAAAHPLCEECLKKVG